MLVVGPRRGWTVSEEPSHVKAASCVEVQVRGSSDLHCRPAMGPVIRPEGEPAPKPVCYRRFCSPASCRGRADEDEEDGPATRVSKTCGSGNVEDEAAVVTAA